MYGSSPVLYINCIDSVSCGHHLVGVFANQEDQHSLYHGQNRTGQVLMYRLSPAVHVSHFVRLGLDFRVHVRHGVVVGLQWHVLQQQSKLCTLQAIGSGSCCDVDWSTCWTCTLYTRYMCNQSKAFCCCFVVTVRNAGVCFAVAYVLYTRRRWQAEILLSIIAGGESLFAGLGVARGGCGPNIHIIVCTLSSSDYFND